MQQLTLAAVVQDDSWQLVVTQHLLQHLQHIWHDNIDACAPCQFTILIADEPAYLCTSAEEILDGPGIGRHWQLQVLEQDIGHLLTA